MSANSHSQVIELLGLDVGEARTGVARANSVARMPQPVSVLPTAQAMQQLVSITKETAASLLVIGMPLQPDGQEGHQAKVVREFAKQLYAVLPVPQVFIDETYTTVEADEYLRKNKRTANQSNDDIAACILLERYFKGAAHV
jgi:putative Holliday junction resolvase